ncbi:zinc finger Y-chromosomal protein 1 isoform X1 [Sabethes cyaneus]|uniref:zinc finger Y-chromosomal protein 1 isoform X1 n=1 Tax=Sabethes cyaneus TaxID=53552 RepID=UPI00237E7087|nr:zinc finger Y-chromosomal protein 1 isoform X1 [Sabethes cyaneus]
MGRKRKSRAPVKITQSPKQIKIDPSPLQKEEISENEPDPSENTELLSDDVKLSTLAVSTASPRPGPSQSEPVTDGIEQSETEPTDDDRSKRVREWMIEQQQQKERPDSIAGSGEPETVESPVEDPLEEQDYPMEDDNSQLMTGTEVPLRHRLKAYTEKEILNSVMYECEWFKCGFETTEDMEYMTHVDSHSVEYLRGKRDLRDIPCLWDLCDFKAANADDMESHLHFHAYHNRMKTHGASLSNIIEIPKCNSDSRRRNCIDMYNITFRCEWEDCEEYYNKAQLFFNHANNHVQDQFPVDKRSRKEPVQCQWAFCKQTYRRASIGLEHIRRHSTERTIGCYTCGAMFVSRLKYIDHCKRQVEYHNREYPCTQCNKLFATKQLMVDHKNIHNKKYACSFCPMMWPSRKALAYHIRYRHVDEKPFKCHLCSHRAVTARDLRIHTSIHESSHLKRCKEPGCTAAYKSEISLRKHLSMHHMGLPPDVYACHLCPKEYKNGTGLSRHFMVCHKLDREPGYVRFLYRLDVLDDKYRLATYLDAELRSGRDTDADVTDPNVSNADQSLLSTTVGSDSTWTSYSIESWRPLGQDKIAIRMMPGKVFEKEPKKSRRKAKPRRNSKSQKTGKTKSNNTDSAAKKRATHVRARKAKKSSRKPSTEQAELVSPSVDQSTSTVPSVQEQEKAKPNDKEDNVITTENIQQSSPGEQRNEPVASEFSNKPLPNPSSNEPSASNETLRKKAPRSSNGEASQSGDDLITETVGEFTITMSRTDKSNTRDGSPQEPPPQKQQPLEEAIDSKELVKQEIVRFNDIELVKQYLQPDCAVVISIDETDTAGNVLQNQTINAIQYSCKRNMSLDCKPPIH